MPARVLLSDSAFAAVELSGVVRWRDVAAALRGMYGHPEWRCGSDVLWDATAVTAVDIAPADLPDVRAAFSEVASAREGGRTAFLVAKGGMDELWALFPRLGPPSTRQTRIFRDRHEALAFLGRTALPDELAVAAVS